MNRLIRWLLFGGVTIALLFLLVAAPAGVASLVFVGVVVASVLIAFFNQRNLQWRDIVHNLQWAQLNAHWQAMQRTSLRYKQMPRIRNGARLSALGAMLALITAWTYFHPYNYYHEAMLGWNYTLLALLLALFPLWVFLSSEDIAPAQSIKPPQQVIIRWRVLLVGFLCWLILVQTTLIRPFDEGTISHHLQALLFVFGCASLVIGLGGWRWHPSMVSALIPRRSWLPVALILSIGIFVRIFDLEYGIHRFVDEVHFLYAVSRLWYAGDQALLMPHGGTTAFTWMYPYVQSIISTITGPSLTGLRLASVIFGVVQIWGAYELGKHMLNRRAGMFMALALATFPLHVHFSRLGINNIVDPTFAVLGFAFFVRGMRLRRQIDFALAGVMFGLTTYFYEGGRLFYAPFVALWVLWLVIFLRRGRGYALPTLRQSLIVAVGALTLIGSFYYVWITNFVPLLPRYQSVGGNLEGFVTDIILNPSARTVWHYLQVPFLTIIHYPSLDSFFHGDQPFVLWLVVPFFLIGMIVSLWRVRRVDGALIFWWVIAGAVANMVMGSFQQSPRYAVLMPVLGMTSGLGAYWLTEWLRRMVSWHVSWTRLVGAILIGTICTYQMVYYLGEFLPLYYERQFYDEVINGIPVRDTDDVLFRAMTLPEDVHVQIIAREFFGAAGYGAVMTYYGRHKDLQLERFFPDEITPEYLLALSPIYTYAFFIEPDDSATYTLLADYFDLVGPEFSPYDIPAERQMALYMAYPTSRTLNDPRRWEQSQTP